MTDYYERRKAIKDFVASAITPLLEGVVVQKLMQAGEFIRSEMKSEPLDWSIVATPESILAAEDGGGAVASVITEMISVAAGEYEGAHEDFDPWTAENRAIIDKWQCRIRDAIAAHPSQAGVREAYDELLYAVGRKFPGESRHATALRYIREAEVRASAPGMEQTTKAGDSHGR